jgi:hypothetical protein
MDCLEWEPGEIRVRLYGNSAVNLFKRTRYLERLSGKKTTSCKAVMAIIGR